MISEIDVECSWKFRSHRKYNDIRRYTVAQWIWEANKRNSQIENLGLLFAGVIIQHSCQPCYVSCKVQGKLASSLKKYRYGDEDDEIPQFLRIVPLVSDQDISKDADGLESLIKQVILSSG